MAIKKSKSKKVKVLQKVPQPVSLALEELKQTLLKIYNERLSGIYLYGSYARGDFHHDSDVDLIIAIKGKVNPHEEISQLSEMISEICLRYDVLISVFPVPEEWMRERKSPLFENVRREGVIL